MAINVDLALAPFRFLERTTSSLPPLPDLAREVNRALSALNLPPEKLRGRRIAVTVGSRGIANLREIVRAVCGWLKGQGAEPFVFPAMGSHGGATAEGQRELLEGYGVTPEFIGADVRSRMEAVSLGTTSEGFGVFMDRHAWESDGVLVMNRVKSHTDFSGRIESGLLKMMAIGMGKKEGAREGHRCCWKYGFEAVIRAMSAKVLASGKILGGLAVVENEAHQIAVVQAAPPGGIVAQEESLLPLARKLMPRIPFASFHVLIVDEIGKNISGTCMDTKVIGRGVELEPGEAPAIRLIYARDLTAQSAGNATGIGFADVIHDRLFRKIDLVKTYLNTCTSLNLPAGRLPMHLPSDRDALGVALGHLGSPEPREQRIVWIRNTLNLDRLGISESLAREAECLPGWRLAPHSWLPEFESEGNLHSPL